MLAPDAVEVINHGLATASDVSLTVLALLVVIAALPLVSKRTADELQARTLDPWGHKWSRWGKAEVGTSTFR